MIVCPLCNAQISDDFGVIECPSCSAQLIIHMDGRVEYSGTKDAPTYDSDEKTPVPEKKAEDKFEFGDAAKEFEMPNEHDAPIPVVDGAPPEHEHDQDLMQPEVFSAQEARYEDNDPTMLSPQPIHAEEHHDSEPAPEPAPEPEPEHEAPPPEAPFHSDFDSDSTQEPATEVYRPSSAQDSPDLSDIAKFGNSGQLSGGDGSLRYNLFISGIDTVDVRDAFREAITDRKLVWDIDQILRSLKNGEVLIPNVTPPKAFILISRLRNVPVQVRWEQYALSQT